jgi:hypothetical protein
MQVNLKREQRPTDRFRGMDAPAKPRRDHTCDEVL